MEHDSRRNFIKIIGLAGTSAGLLYPSSVYGFFDQDVADELSNEYFSLSFNKKKGVVRITRATGDPFLENIRFGYHSEGKTVYMDPETYHFSVKKINQTNYAGDFQGLLITGNHKTGLFQYEVQVLLYNDLPAIGITTSLKNTSNRSVNIYSLLPFSLLPENDGYLYAEGYKRCLTNGAIYYDAGRIHPFGNSFTKSSPYGETKGGKTSLSELKTGNETISSWWNVAFFKDYQKEAICCGYIENRWGMGRILASPGENNRISLYTESVFAEGVEVKPDTRVYSDPFVIITGSDPFEALESYAGLTGRCNQVDLPDPVNGWCNWFYTYEFITEEEVIRNAEYAAIHLKPYGFDYIQVDEGYQRAHGDWEGNERFPHGMKWLAERIRSMGLKPGIWISPYLISEKSPVYKLHPEWLVKDASGKPMRVGPWPSEDSDWARNENPARFCLDITHPGAEQWLFELTETLVHQWGYEMIKIDFVAWSVLSANKFYDSGATPASVYRKGIEIMRKAAGNNVHILDCGPGQISAGLIDSMRIELDQNYGYSDAVWRQYFTDSSGSAGAAGKRYYFHGRTWINDADHLCISLLSPGQARAAASIIALSGGNMISGDRLTELDQEKIEILRKVFPSSGLAARPVDLFDSDIPSVFSLDIKKPFGAWTITGVFNPYPDDTISKMIPLNRLGLDPDKEYLLFDFWEQKFLGTFRKEINLLIQPESVRLLSIREKKDFPVVVSTSRHILQGAIELEKLAFDPLTRILNGVSSGPLSSRHSLSIYLPESYPWGQGARSLYHDFGDYNYRLTAEHILTLNLHFRQNTQIQWDVDLSGFS